MKRLYCCLLLGCLIVNAVQAQHKSGSQNRSSKEKYTNLQDTVFAINEVVIESRQKNRTEALKLDVPAKFVPMSTNSISAGMLEKRDIRNIQEAARFLPGVRFRTSYGAFTQFSIRGFDNSVIMVDGVRDERSAIDNSYPFMDLSTVESIELLKGPASALYGQSAVGGVLNIVRKAPQSRQSVYARVAYGSFYHKQATFATGGKLIGPLNYRASVNWQGQEGWRSNATERLSGYLTVGGQLTEKDAIDIRIGTNRDFYATEIGLPATMSNDIFATADNSKYLSKGDLLPGLDRTARYNSESDFMYNRGFNASAQYKHTFGSAAKLMNKLSYTYDDIDYFGTESLDYLTSDKPIYKHYYMTKDKAGNDQKKYIALDSIYYSYPLRFSHIAQTVNNQLEMSGHFYTGGLKHNYLGGYTLVALMRTSYMAYGKGSTGATGPGTTGHGSVYNPHSIGWMEAPFRFATVQRRFMHGFYLQDLIEFSDQLKMQLSGRYDLFRYKTANTNALNGQREYEEPNDDAFNRITNGAFTFRTGLVYLPTEHFSVYGSYGTYFKPITTLYDANTIYVDKNGNTFTPVNGKEVFKPEKGFQLEIGARYEISTTLQANMSLFYINKNNIKQKLASKGDVVNGVPLPMQVQGQVGRMDSRGFDMDITWRPLSNLSLTTGYGYTDAQVREMASNIYMSSDQNKGKQYPQIPKHTFYAYGAYTVSKGALKGFGVNMDTSYQDKIYRNTGNSSQFDAYWLTDIGCSYTLPNNIRLGLNINNLFGKEYYNQALGNQLVPSMPRNFMLSASYTL
ncbi:MAG: TonB-dependent receptor [Bacteroides sp.]